MNSIDTSMLDMEKLKIFNAIRSAENGITTEKLLITLGKEKTYTRKLHDSIHSMIVDGNIPIGSSASKAAHKFGYFIIENKRDHLLAIKTLRSRVEGINKREKVLRNLRVSDEAVESYVQ